jgi:hypothetical protein
MFSYLKGEHLDTLQEQIFERVTKFTLSIDGITCTFDLLKEVEYDVDNLEFASQAALTTKWSCILAKLVRARKNAKRQLEKIRAVVKTEIRTGVIKVAKVTEGSVEENMVLDPRVDASAQLLEDIELSVDFARAVVDGIKDRGSMLYMEGLLRNTEAKMIGSAPSV